MDVDKLLLHLHCRSDQYIVDELKAEYLDFNG